MKSSLIILIFFLLGCVGGLFYTADFDLHILSVDVLYLLMLLLGINLGCNQDLKGFVRQFSFKMLLVPIATVTGTFLFSTIAGFILSQWSIFDCMAVGSVHIPADTRSAFPVISVQSPVSIQCCWQS